MRNPLNQFADRIIRNGEIEEFIDGLLDKGVTLEKLYGILSKHRYTKEKNG